MSNAPRIEAVEIAGPAGKLSGRVETAAQDRGTDVAVVCHPHPLYGGTMDNKVVHTLAAAFRDRQITSVRFNFRGVADSDGGFDQGRGELDDLRAVVAYARARFPGRGLWLGGFSFGSGIAARAAGQIDHRGLVLVAPPITMDYFAGVTLAPSCLVVHGAKDELIPLATVRAWLRSRGLEQTLAVVEDADHFFHGQLRSLRGIVVDHLDATGSPHSAR